MNEDEKRALRQFRTLLVSAMQLKEKFDAQQPIQILFSSYELFSRDLEYLQKLIPKEIIEAGQLLRHAGWITKRLSEGSPDQCYGDVCDICYNDIFYIESLYLDSLSGTSAPINSESDVIAKQLKLLNGLNCDPISWLYTTERLLKNIFPTENITLSKHRSIKTDLGFTLVERKRYTEILNGYIQELELRNKNLFPADKWEKVHPIIARVSKSRFETEHYGDSVESAFKEINDVIKKAYLKKVGKEEDGDALMRKAFSANGPIFYLADTSLESGRNIQQGYMDIFAGSIKGIRNPKAHANLDVHPEEAWEMIILASHLMRMWDKHN